MVKQKIKMEVGKRYRGYGLLNEYGEYTFEPCQVETNPKNMKKIQEHDNTCIYESENFYKIAVKVPKGRDYKEILHTFTYDLSRAIYNLRQYIQSTEL
ncbi:MAG: hypothetical protein J6S52_01220 [Prevotella sp.]|nr:hypothetical protein [Prevotella sp.]